jgi:DNA helicase II / ATP-dependent DNA helicase PcrA
MATQVKEKVDTRERSEARFDELYAALNTQQKLAVDTIEGPVMVMAGPGTGKTQVLAMRIAAILRQTQMDPWNILCLTFTESGVVAMRERLLSIIGTPAYYVKIHTFHSFCNEVISEHPELFYWTRGVKVISDIERVMMLRGIVDKLSARSPLKPFGSPYLYFRDIIGNIQDLKQEDISPQQFSGILDHLQSFAGSIETELKDFLALKSSERTAVECQRIHESLVAAAKEATLPDSMRALLMHMWQQLEEGFNEADGKRETSKACTKYKHTLKRWFEKTIGQLPRQQEMAKVYARYQEELKTQGRLDFEDMIIKVVEELRGNKDLLATYQEQFQYILVDEYQDTNGAQNDVVDLLGSFDEQPNIFVVGDDKQSIYRFQGASLANMLHFYERYKEAITVVSLKENYRSQQTVLDAAQGVIAFNKESVARYVPGVTQELVAVSGRTPHALVSHTFESEDAEDYFVAQKAKQLIDSGVVASEIAVLYRNNRDGESLLATMQRLGVPARVEIGENILHDHFVKQWIVLLDWIATGKNGEELARIVQYPWWHLPPVDVLKAIHFANQRYRSLYLVLASEKDLTAAGIQDITTFLEFVSKLAQWRKDAVNLPLQLFLEKLLVESHFLDHVIEHDEEAASLQKVTALLHEAKKLNLAHPDFTLIDFIRHLELLEEHEVALMTSPWQVTQHAVRLMSAHKAKGLEFEHVFIIRLNDKHWGNEREGNKAPLPQGLVKFDYVVAADNNEDERRLFYVALTRAKQGVGITRAAHNMSGRPTVPSLFLSELPAGTVASDVTRETNQQALARLKTRLRSPVPDHIHGDVREYIKSLLTGYAMSVTHLNNYLECPRRFYFRNLLRVPTAKSKSLSLGSAVHEALRALFTTIKETGKRPGKTFFLERFREAMQAELLPVQEKADALEKGEHMLDVYYDHYKDEFHDNSLLEYDFASHNIYLHGLKLTGKVDKVEIVDNKRKLVNVVDFKTGKVSNGLTKLGKEGPYRRQLVFYQLLCNESQRFPYEMVSGEIDFIEESEKRGFVKKKIKVTHEEVEELKKTIQRVWSEIQQLKFLEKDGGCGKKDCEYCN